MSIIMKGQKDCAVWAHGPDEALLVLPAHRHPTAAATDAIRGLHALEVGSTAGVRTSGAPVLSLDPTNLGMLMADWRF